MYDNFVWWLSCLTMEETFIFTYISALILGVTIGIPLAFLLDKKKYIEYPFN